MPNLISYHKLGQTRTAPRIWLESNRLATNGFTPGTPFLVTSLPNGFSIQKSLTGNRQVSKHQKAGKTNPLIELCSNSLNTHFQGIHTIKAKASYGRIDVTSSLQSLLIRKSQQKQGPFRTLEIFSGGGTLSEALKTNPNFRLIAGIEIDPAFANIWSDRHPDATLIQADIRLIHPAEVPKFDILLGGIPCTAFSTAGRAKKQLKGKPEEGDTGDLFIPTLQLIAYHLPKACIFENVPSFSTSVAGNLLKTTLKHLGYHFEEHTIEPHSQWNEPSDRRRWALIATLEPGFSLSVPNEPFTGTVANFLNPPSPTDQQEAERIAGTINALKNHQARHAEMGHGFGFTTINQNSTKIPTIVKSYHKINSGPFVETPWGPRLLTLSEAERIMGCSSGTDHYATGIQVLGQGCQTRIWNQILMQVGQFLNRPYESSSHPPHPSETSNTHPSKTSTITSRVFDTLEMDLFSHI